MSDEPDTLNGTNSGGVALNLAYSLKPRQLLLFGFDYRRGPKGSFIGSSHRRIPASSAPTPSTTTAIATGRASLKGGRAIPRRNRSLNVSDTTVVTAFKRISPKEYSKAFA
jgi:hypothetical protein